MSDLMERLTERWLTLPTMRGELRAEIARLRAAIKSASSALNIHEYSQVATILRRALEGK